MKKCKLKTCKNKATINPYEKGLFCSARCALSSVRTKKHQREAGKKGALINILKYRGTGKGYIKEISQHQHRVVMEKFLKRKLKKGEIVHHVDGDKKNNHLNNLKVMTQSEHASLHLKLMERDNMGRLLKLK